MIAHGFLTSIATDLSIHNLIDFLKKTDGIIFEKFECYILLASLLSNFFVNHVSKCVLELFECEAVFFDSRYIFKNLDMNVAL